MLHKNIGGFNEELILNDQIYKKLSCQPDIIENVEVNSHGNLWNGHAEFTHEQKYSTTHMFLEHQTQDGREEVGDADDEGAVVGVDDRVGLLEDESRVEGDCTLWKLKKTLVNLPWFQKPF